MKYTGWSSRTRECSGTNTSRRCSLLLVLLSLAAYVEGADKHDWKTGKVLDSHAAKTYVVSGASSNDWAGNGTEVQVRQMAIQSTQLIILGAEYSYVIDDTVEKAVGLQVQGSLTRAIANRKHGCRYIVGNPIQYAQEKNSLYVRDADGKECKLDIVRQERLQTLEAVQPSPDRSNSQSQPVAALRPVEEPITGAQTDAAADAKFTAQLNAEFPEIILISNKIAAGDEHAGEKSELWQRAVKIYREVVAQDPGLNGSRSALLLACRQAKRELEADKKAAPQADSLAPPKVRFTSNPPGAEISIDGEYFGSTPTLEVGQKEGMHNVRMKRQCYRPWERVIILKPGDTRAILAELEPEPVDPTKPSVAGLCDAQ